MSPEAVTSLIALGTFIMGGGGVIAYLKFYKNEVPQSEATVESTKAQAQLTMAQANQVNAQAESTAAATLTAALGIMKDLANETSNENKLLRQDLNSAEDRIDSLEDRIDSLEHHYGPRGPHGDWDLRALLKLRAEDPDYPIYPAPSQDSEAPEDTGSQP